MEVFITAKFSISWRFHDNQDKHKIEIDKNLTFFEITRFFISKSRLAYRLSYYQSYKILSFENKTIILE